MIQDNMQNMAVLDHQGTGAGTGRGGLVPPNNFGGVAGGNATIDIEDVGDDSDEDVGGEDADDGEGQIDLDAVDGNDDDAIVWPAPPSGHTHGNGNARGTGNATGNGNHRAGRSHHSPTNGSPQHSSNRSRRQNGNHSSPSLAGSAGPSASPRAAPSSTSNVSTSGTNAADEAFRTFGTHHHNTNGVVTSNASSNAAGPSRAGGNHNGSVSSTSTIRPVPSQQTPPRQQRSPPSQPTQTSSQSQSPQARSNEVNPSHPPASRSRNRNGHRHRHGHRARGANGQSQHSPTASPTGSGSGSHESEGDVVYPVRGPSNSSSSANNVASAVASSSTSNQARPGRRSSGGRGAGNGGGGSGSQLPPPGSPIIEDQSDAGPSAGYRPDPAYPGLSSYMQSNLPLHPSTRLQELIAGLGPGPGQGRGALAITDTPAVGLPPQYISAGGQEPARSSEESDTPLYPITQPHGTSRSQSQQSPRHRDPQRAAGEAAIARFEASARTVTRSSPDGNHSGDSTSSFVVVDETSPPGEGSGRGRAGGSGRKRRGRARPNGNVTPAASEPTTEGSASDDIVGGHINAGYVHVDDVLMASSSQQSLLAHSDSNLGGSHSGRGRSAARPGLDGAVAASSSHSSPSRRTGLQQQISSLFRRGTGGGGE